MWVGVSIGHLYSFFCKYPVYIIAYCSSFSYWFVDAIYITWMYCVAYYTYFSQYVFSMCYFLKIWCLSSLSNYWTIWALILFLFIHLDFPKQIIIWPSNNGSVGLLFPSNTPHCFSWSYWLTRVFNKDYLRWQWALCYLVPVSNIFLFSRIFGIEFEMNILYQVK